VLRTNAAFWFYEYLKRRSSIVIHTAWCRACNAGRGSGGRLCSSGSADQAPSGRWCGPYADCPKAIAAAQQILVGSSRRAKLCRHCLDVDPIARHRIPRRLQSVPFWVQVTNADSVIAHASTCPHLPGHEPPASPDPETDASASGIDGIWYGPHDRLAAALSKAEELIGADPRRRMRHCMVCGRNGRLMRLDDLLATRFACDAPAEAAISVGTEPATTKQIVCPECGKGRRRFKTHLRQAHQMTPGQYRAKWRLSADFPLIPPGIRKPISHSAWGIFIVAQLVPDRIPMKPTESS